MTNQKLNSKTKEWAKRYIPAEILGTVIAVVVAWMVYADSHSYVAAAAAGWLAEGIGFYGYFITTELWFNHQKYRKYPPFKRYWKAVTLASRNLFVEFAPAEILDNFLIRPFALFIIPQYVHPYPVGFLVAKLSADLIFYLFAIAGYEFRKHWLH